MTDVCSRMYRTASFGSRNVLFGEPERSLGEGVNVSLVSGLGVFGVGVMGLWGECEV